MAVHHPRGPELIDQHAKAFRPERFLNGHDGSLGVFSQCLKDAFRFGRFLHLDIYREALRLLKAVRRSVRTHKHLIANGQAGMQDLAAPLCRHSVGRGRAFMRNHGFNLAAQTFGVKLEGVLALTVEEKIRIYLHGSFSVL